MDDTTITEEIAANPEAPPVLEKPIAEMDTPKLVELYNKLTGKSIKRFSSRGDAIKRVKEAMAGSEGIAPPLPNDTEDNVTNTETATDEKVKRRKAAPAKKKAKAAAPVKKKTTKKAKVTAPKSKEPKVAYNGGLGGVKGKLLEQFNVREGSNRQKLVEFMVDNLGKSFLANDLIKATYGKKDDEAGAKLFMVMKGMQGMIDKYKIKVKIERTKTEEGMTYGLKNS